MERTSAFRLPPETVAAARKCLAPVMKEAEIAFAEVGKTFQDHIETLIKTGSANYEEDHRTPVLRCWLCGCAYHQSGEAKEHFDPKTAKAAGSFVVPQADLEELESSTNRIWTNVYASIQAKRFCGSTAPAMRIIVGTKPGRNYVVAAMIEAYTNGSVTLVGRNSRKVRAIAEICKLCFSVKEMTNANTVDGLSIQLELAKNSIPVPPKPKPKQLQKPCPLTVPKTHIVEEAAKERGWQVGGKPGKTKLLSPRL